MKCWFKLLDEELKKTGRANQFDRCQMEIPSVTLLMRCRTNGISGLCLVIGTIRLDESMQNQGWFKSFIKYCCEINPWDKVVIEDVENKYLLIFCQKHKFDEVSKRYQTSFIVNQKAIEAIDANEFCY